MNKRFLLFVPAFLAAFPALLGQKPAQDIPDFKPGLNINYRSLHWTAPITTRFTENETRSFLWFDGANYDAERQFVPLFTEMRELNPGSTGATVEIINPVYQLLDNASSMVLGTAIRFIGTEPEVKSVVMLSRKVPYAHISILPLRKNEVTGAIEKLVSFTLKLEVSNSVNARNNAVVNPAFATSSVLANGTWYKIGVVNKGIHKLDYAFFNSMGIDMATLDPRNIRVYGNAHGQIPFSNTGQHEDDLLEYSVQVQGESDGVFNTGDYLLFYGASPNSVYYANSPNSWEDTAGAHKHFHHHVHNYSDTSYYFICTDLGPGKRIASQASSSLTPTHTVDKFDDFQFHESDNTNLIKSGREWYGEQFDIVNSYSFGFSFPNIDMTTDACVEVSLLNHYDNATVNYTVSAQSATTTVPITATVPGCFYCPVGNSGSGSLCFNPTGPVITVTISKPALAGSYGYLNWVRVNARRNLIMSGGMMGFRDTKSLGAGNVAAYSLAGYTPSLLVWDVTDQANVMLQSFTVNAGSLTWNAPADSLREYMAFDGTQFYTPKYFGQVGNQNLHAMQPVDFIIVTHPDFISQANQLAEWHQQEDNLSYLIVTPQQIYNEFSAGSQDVTAIRDFVRMLYFRAPTAAEAPRYLLLLGDGSYDHKERMSSNTNYIPTFQNLNSYSPTESYVSDEYYGLLDDNGAWDDSGDYGLVDIGIGRFPVHTATEAQQMVDKIRFYKTRQAPVTDVSACSSTQCSRGGEWKNQVVFFADDEDANQHMQQAESLATMVDTANDNYNVDKIYFDAYPQEQTPGGERYPDVNDEFDKHVDRGCLILNYTGHGGEVGLAHERVLEVSQINAWKNMCNMPLFFTATCEFARFDDPARTAAGEYVFLNPNGGGIALFTTVRLVYSGPNFNLNQNFYRCAFTPINGEMPRIGDLYRITKRAMGGNSTNSRNFTLLGDPAMMLNYPVNTVVTSEINNVPVTSTSSDTLHALDLVTVKGYLADTGGVLMSGFNGVLYPTVFDKAKTITTLGNDPPNAPYTFKLQKSVLYHGKVSVVNGYFQFSFVVPRDISYQFGIGRISYYADNGVTDAAGNYEKIVIGGSNLNAPADLTGPEVKLFLNDSNFVPGGITNSSPSLFAIIRDSNGVNTVGNGIGHDIVAVLDEETDHAIVLNDYYQADMNSYQSGKIVYPFSGLAAGTHTLSLKVWDVYNNSTTVKTEFLVTESASLELAHVLNYPNPFTTNTSFFIEYNQCCTQYDVMIQVFTVSGKLVKTINQQVNSDGFRSEAITWDGRDDYGDRIGRGVYVYRVVARSEDGKSAEKYEKLVIL
jgi:hypothetical protein